MSIDNALEALGGALSGAGVPLWQPPETSAGLDELEAQLAPMRLPDEVREFWRQVDVRTLRASPYPNFHTPEFALESWRMARGDFAAFQPLALVQVGYESHAVMSAELDVDDLAGGALFQWRVSDPGGFRRRFNSMAEWVGHVAELITHGSYRRREHPNGPRLLVRPPEHSDEDRAGTVPPAHPRYGDTLHIGGNIRDWPEHWQRANGVGAENLILHGATHTVADVLSSPPAQKLRGTIAARVVDVAPLGGGTRIRVDDGTGSLDIACPVSTTLLGPLTRDWYEFDIAVTPAARQLPADPDATGERISSPVERVTAKLMARYADPATAAALAIRRMPAPHA